MLIRPLTNSVSVAGKSTGVKMSKSNLSVNGAAITLLSGVAAIAVFTSIAIASQTDSESVVVTGTRNDPNAIICKTSGSPGSHLVSSECRTKKQWDDIHRQAKQTLDGIQMKALTAPPPM